MFKKVSIGLAAALSLGAAGYANAADYVEPEPTCGNWSGIYVGAHAGYLWGNGKGDSDDIAAIDADVDPDGFIGGALLGGNFQTDCLVFGLEGDIGFGDVDGSGDTGIAGIDADADLKWNGHVRARLGYSLGEVLPFIAGGLSAAKIDVDTDGFGDDNNTHWGWTVGGGIDWAVSEQFIIRAEYLYDDYGSKTYDFDGVDVDGDLTASTVRAALIWNFGGL
ncbi:outer membrane protein [Taklimakanibacter deserti]|uniref:outer membrane protein n=1 Tax=Taklimakanibacter deserti TaxID=2267839 RepID=UPI000E64B43D